MLVPGGDEQGTTFLERGGNTLHLEHAAALEHDVDLVVLVRLLPVGFGGDEHVDTDLEPRRGVDDLIATTSFGESLTRLFDVERVLHGQDTTSCDARVVKLDLDAIFRPDAGLRSGWRRMPAVAGEAMIATSHPLPAQAGLRAFRSGGNAVDAAVAAAAMLTVAEPTENGIGGDAFALVWHAGALHGINGSGRSPAVLDGAPHEEHGPRSVTVPGALQLWADLAERFGRLGLDAAVGPASELAERGLVCSARISHKWATAQHAPWPAPGLGGRYRLPELATTLGRIASEGPGAFYRGETAA